VLIIVVEFGPDVKVVNPGEVGESDEIDVSENPRQPPLVLVFDIPAGRSLSALGVAEKPKDILRERIQ
jgi:hypothetical protein